MRDKRGKVVYEPYRIKVLNTINFSKSMKYNPLAYVRSEKDMQIDIPNKKIVREKYIAAQSDKKTYLTKTLQF